MRSCCWDGRRVVVAEMTWKLGFLARASDADEDEAPRLRSLDSWRVRPLFAASTAVPNERFVGESGGPCEDSAGICGEPCALGEDDGPPAGVGGSVLSSESSPKGGTRDDEEEGSNGAKDAGGGGAVRLMLLTSVSTAALDERSIGGPVDATGGRMGGASGTFLARSRSSSSSSGSCPLLIPAAPPCPLWLNEPSESRLARLFLLRLFGRGLEPAPPPSPIEKTDAPLTLALRPLAAVLPIELTDACPRGARLLSSSSVPALLLNDARGTSDAIGRCGGIARSSSSSSSSCRSTLGGSLRDVVRPWALPGAPDRLRNPLLPALLAGEAVRVCGTDAGTGEDVGACEGWAVAESAGENSGLLALDGGDVGFSLSMLPVPSLSKSLSPNMVSVLPNDEPKSKLKSSRGALRAPADADADVGFESSDGRADVAVVDACVDADSTVGPSESNDPPL